VIIKMARGTLTVEDTYPLSGSIRGGWPTGFRHMTTLIRFEKTFPIFMPPYLIRKGRDRRRPRTARRNLFRFQVPPREASGTFSTRGDVTLRHNMTTGSTGSDSTDFYRTQEGSPNRRTPLAISEPLSPGDFRGNTCSFPCQAGHTLPDPPSNTTAEPVYPCSQPRLFGPTGHRGFSGPWLLRL